jgi:glycosyltransferase involved in cell wall biosynthesis
MSEMQGQSLEGKPCIDYNSRGMVRAWQLVDERLDWSSQRLADQIHTGLDAEFRIERKTVPHALPVLARRVFALRRAIELPQDRILHAFGARALAAATLLKGAIIFSPTEFPSPRFIRWLRAILEYRRPLHVICPTDTMRRAFVESGIAIEQCHIIRPGVDFSLLRKNRDPQARAALGFSPDDHVILAAGESTRQTNHELAVWACGILHVLDARHRLLLWRRGPHAEKVARLAHRTQSEHFCISAGSHGFEQLIAVADSVLVTATDPIPALPICTSMAGGLPIVSMVSATVAELLEDRHNALLVGQPIPRAIAQRVLDLRDDRHLAWSIADRARADAYEYFSLSRMLTQYRALFGQLARGEKIDVVQPAPGAGSRFIGRA